MYIPDLSLARSEVHIDNRGTVVLFMVCDLKYLSEDDPYRAVVLELSKEGLHRNVFMVDDNRLPIWRVQAYERTVPDYFVEIEAVGDACDYIVGYTFQGVIFHIGLSDGALTDRRWEKP